MAEWRVGRGWSEEELEARLATAAALGRNFDVSVDEMNAANGWNEYYSEATVAVEPPGPPVPDGPFERGRVAISDYAFSDPRIVIGHFDPRLPLLGRRMLLEMRAVRALHYLAAVVVGAVRSEEEENVSVFGFRYDTLAGHIERGNEWFLLTKTHATGDIRFRIQAAWLPGEFPNWWSRVGFSLLGPVHQKIWHHRAHTLLAQLIRLPDPSAPAGPGGLAHTDPHVIFQRSRGHDGY